MSLLAEVTTMGVPPSLALWSRLMPFASPVSMCRLTNDAQPAARAYPSAMPIAVVSWVVSTYSRSG
jgi:hypothetical protein